MKKQELIDAVIEDLKKGFEIGDYTVLNELLSFIPVKNLIQSLPEKDWNKFNNIEDDKYIPTIEEQNYFINNWGQTHDEICSNLGYDPDNSDDLLIIDYFWYLKEKCWIPIFSSMYNEKENLIADYLRYNSNVL